MPMRIPPTIDTDPSRIATMFPRISPIANSLSPATQSNILGILQREQDRAVALLSSSPLLTSLFVSYANQAAALETSTPSTESEEWKALEDTISSLREEIDKLKPENVEMEERLKVSAASQEAFRSQVSGLKEANVAKQDEIKSLQAELLEAKVKFDRLSMNSKAESATLQAQILNLEEERAELKDAVVEQQMKIWRLERRDSGSSPKTMPSDNRELEGIKDKPSTNVSARIAMSGSGADFPPQSPPATGPSLSIHPHRKEPSLGTPPTLQKLEAKDKHPAIPEPQPARSPIPFPHQLQGTPAPVTPKYRDSSLESKELTDGSTAVEEHKPIIAHIALSQKVEGQPGCLVATPPTVTSGKKKKVKGGAVSRPVASMPPSNIFPTATYPMQLPVEEAPTPPPVPTITLSTREGDTLPTLPAPAKVQNTPPAPTTLKPNSPVLPQPQPKLASWF